MTDKLFCDVHLETLDKQDTIKIVHDTIGYAGIFRRSENKIYINLGDISKFMWSEDMIKVVCETIVHEYMHKLLFNMFDAYTCTAFDNIAKSFTEDGVI